MSEEQNTFNQLSAILEQIRQKLETYLDTDPYIIKGNYRIVTLELCPRMNYAPPLQAQSEIHPNYIPAYVQVEGDLSFVARAERVPTFYGHSIDLGGHIDTDGAIHIDGRRVSLHSPERRNA
jgi:hypothetical protein